MDRYRCRIAMLSWAPSSGAQSGGALSTSVKPANTAISASAWRSGSAQGSRRRRQYRAESSGKLSAGTRRTMSDERGCRIGSVPGRCTPG